MPVKGLSRRFPSVYSILVKLTGLSFSIVSFFWSFKAARVLRSEDGLPLNLAMVIGWHAALVWAGAIGWHLIKETGNIRRQIRGAIVAVGSILLTVGSIGASFATIAQDVTQSTRTNLESSREYKSLTSELASLDEQIKKADAVEDAYLTNKDPESALIASRHTTSLRTKRNTAEANVARLESASGTSVSTSPVDIAISLLRGESNLPTKALAYFWLQLFISVVVDVIGMSALAIWIEGFIPNALRTQTGASASCTDSGASSAGAKIRNIASAPKQVHHKVSRETTGEGRPDTGATDGKNNRYTQAKELIAQGAIAPTLRALKKLKLCQTTAERYLHSMQEEGILHHNGRTYELVA